MKDALFNNKVACTFERKLSVESFYEPLTLKTKELFSKLTYSTPSSKEKSKTGRIIETYNISNRKQLTTLYIKNDALLLTDVFQFFVDTCKSGFGINPPYAYTKPTSTWEAGLKKTGVE